ncbi:MAG TPA: hypothetical protein VFT43_02100 [Candidatus Polarisedimenticolia bacterium]|nr:hypothetical protein [Candidatus Polarisedimenticolia bacterium]
MRIEGSSAGGQGISWIHMVPAVLLGAWTIQIATAEQPYSLLDYVNLAFHEAGHIVFSPFGETLHILGGTLLQIFVPLILVGYFLLKRAPYSAALCGWWVGENLVNISVYMADARDLRLPLVGGGEQDWTQLFYQFGLLGADAVAAVSKGTHHLGVVLMLAASGWAACFALFPSVRKAVDELIADRLPSLDSLFG